MKQLVIIASIALMLVVVGCAPSGVPPEPSPPGSEDTLVGQAFRPGIVLPADYSPPWDIATGDMKFTTTPEGFSDITSGVSFGLAANGDAIYYQGYYHNHRTGGWVPFEYDGPRLMVDGVATNWIEDTATSTLDFASPFDLFRSGGENYVLVYICDWDAGWHCGPRELGDTTYRWTIQSFSLCGEGTVVDGEACRAVSGAISEVCSNGADDDHNGDVDCDDAACSDDVACTGEVPAEVPASAPVCQDTDGGNEPTRAGTVTVVDGATSTDVCSDPLRNILTEIVCDATRATGIWGTDYSCSNLDQSFTCIEGPEGAFCGAPATPTTASTCVDTDVEASDVRIVGGKVTLADGSETFDACAADNERLLQEASCVQGGLLGVGGYLCTYVNPDYTCIPSPNGAFCGAPATPTTASTCVDSDAGAKDVRIVGGKVTLADGSETFDACTDVRALNEMYCAKDGTLDVVGYPCTDINPDYACIPSPNGAFCGYG